MTRLRSIALTAGLLAALTLTGCKAPGADGSGPPLWEQTATEGLNCADDRVEVDGTVDRHLFDGDDVPDYFVTRHCTSTVKGSPRGGQLEIFRGGSDRAHPARLGVIVRNWQGYTLDGCVAFVEGKIYTLVTKGTTRSLWEAQRAPGGVRASLSKDQRQDIGCT